MERIVERPGALDVHKASVTACVRVWQGRELQERMAEFATTVHGLLALRAWLEALGGRQVAMEAPPGSQDRHQGCAVALPTVGGRAVEGELRAPQADPHPAELDAVSQDASRASSSAPPR